MFTRGANPIWYEVDLSANSFDDTFYLFVLQNTIPYIPANVYHTNNDSTPWTQPIRFLANGTLPVDIFFDPTMVYRLEFRQGPTQNDPLIYLVENYTAPSGGIGPIDTTAFATDNQITNPQFSLISFSSPLTLTSVTNPAPIEVAPGWFLNLTGTGSLTVSIQALNDNVATINPTNAPYALVITTDGWSTAYLSQRFQQNGMEWANKTVSSSVTALSANAGTNISAALYDSTGTLLASVLDSVTISGTFSEYTDYGTLGPTTNPDVPPDAYIEYRLILPNTGNVYVTSFQLVVGNLETVYPYLQDTIERQVDHTFHYYRESTLRENKESILTGWDFGLNPWQYYPTGTTNLATFGYTADQTIMVQQAYVASATGNNISTARAVATSNYGFVVTAVTATNQFAMIQYISPQTMRPHWTKTLSSMVKLFTVKQSGSSNLRMKMRLIERAGLPPTLAQGEPIASWTALGEPVFSSGWTAIIPENDPVYNLAAGFNRLLFEKFVLDQSSSDNMTLGIVLYTLDPMDQTGTPDNITFNNISLVENEFAVDCNSLSYDETLRRCQYYYETSFAPGAVGTVTTVNAVYAPMNAYFNSGTSKIDCFPNGFGFQYKVVKPITPTLSIYSGSSTNAGNVTAVSNGSSGSASAEAALATYFTAFGTAAQYGFAFRGTGLSTMCPEVSSTTAGSAGILYHYVANATLGQ